MLRITNFSNWSNGMTIEPGHTGIGFEFRHTPWSDLTELSQWDNEEVVTYCLEQLRGAGFDVSSDVISSHGVRIPQRTPLDASALYEHKNIARMVATNLAGTTREGLQVPELIYKLSGRG